MGNVLIYHLLSRTGIGIIYLTQNSPPHVTLVSNNYLLSVSSHQELFLGLDKVMQKLLTPIPLCCWATLYRISLNFSGVYRSTWCSSGERGMLAFQKFKAQFWAAFFFEQTKFSMTVEIFF